MLAPSTPRANLAELEYEWHFEPGGPIYGQVVEHSFLTETEITAVVRDADGAEDTRALRVRPGGALGASAQMEPRRGERHGLDVQLGGSVSGRMQGEVRPYAGQFLGSTGDQCRLLITAWDPQLLGVMVFMADLPYLPDEEGLAWGGLVPRVLSLGFLKTGEEFDASYAKNTKGFTAGLGALARAKAEGEAAAAGEETSSEFWAGVDFGVNGTPGLDAVGLKSGERELQTWEKVEDDGVSYEPYGPGVARSPVAGEEGIGVEHHGRPVKLTLVPHDYLRIDFGGVMLDDPDTGRRSRWMARCTSISRRPRAMDSSATKAAARCRTRSPSTR